MKLLLKDEVKAIIERKYGKSAKELKDMPLERNRFYNKFLKDILDKL